MATETLAFHLLARDSASRVFDRVGDSASQAESRFSKVGRGLANVGRVAATALATGAVAGGYALKKLTDEAEEARRVGRLTESVIRSTGGAANVTARQVATLAESISNKTGVDDEAVQTGANLLLTFKNVRNEAGKGADIFNQATQAAVDLSAAGFGSIDSASKMLGKALNDPIAGLTALGRAGVTFTEQQKEQIKAMVESGNVLGAQKAIMAEVQSQVGGAAAATGTAMDKLKVTVGNLAERVGSYLLPYIDKAAAWLGQHLPAALDRVIGFVDRFKSSVGDSGALSTFGDIIQRVGNWVMTSLVPAFQKVGQEIGPKVQAMFASIGDTVAKHQGTFRDLGAIFTGVIVPILGKVAGILVDTVGPAFKGVMWIVQNVAIPAFKVLTETWLTLVDVLVSGAAKAFGWVPGIGPKLKRANKEFDEFAAEVRATLDGLGKGGEAFGRDMALGIAAGIRNNEHVPLAVARNTANKITAAMRAEVGAHSPAEATIALGEDLMDGLPVGFMRAAGGASSGIGKTLRGLLDELASIAAKRGADVRDALAGPIGQVRDKLRSLRDEVRQIMSSTRSSVMGALDLGGLGAVGEDGVAANPAAQIAAFREQVGSFASALKDLAGRRLAPTLVAGVAALGPAQGLTAAQALAALDEASIAQVNADIAAAESLATQLGNTVVTTTSLPADIKRQEDILTELRSIKEQLANGKTEIHVHGSVVTKERLVVEIRDALEELDRRRGKKR